MENKEVIIDIIKEDKPYVFTDEDIRIENQLKHIAELKANLAATDYQAIKYAEGRMTDEEYAPIGEQRQTWRDEINELEK